MKRSSTSRQERIGRKLEAVAFLKFLSSRNFYPEIFTVELDSVTWTDRQRQAGTVPV